jgi:hypothetical protein
MTQEEMQTRILELEDQNKLLSETSETNVSKLAENEIKISQLQEKNQDLFLRITTTKTETKKEDPITSCEDFAKTIKL